MANITENLVNTVIADADLTTIETSAQTINDTLDPYLRSLTDEERESLFALNVDNKVFVEEALQEISTNGAILPDAISETFLKNDLTFFNQLDEMETQIRNQLRKVQDTKRLAGHEAFATALAAYQLYKALSVAGISGAKESADRLGERFLSIGGAGRPADEGSGAGE